MLRIRLDTDQVRGGRGRYPPLYGTIYSREETPRANKTSMRATLSLKICKSVARTKHIKTNFDVGFSENILET